MPRPFLQLSVQAVEFSGLFGAALFQRCLQLSLPLLQHLFTALQTLLPTQLAGQGVLQLFQFTTQGLCGSYLSQQHGAIHASCPG